MKKPPIVEPPVEEEWLDTYKDPPLTDNGDAPLDRNGHLKEEGATAKSFNDILKKYGL